MNDPIADSYRRQAAEAQRWAEQAVDEEHRARWREIAERWIKLAQEREQRAESR